MDPKQTATAPSSPGVAGLVGLALACFISNYLALHWHGEAELGLPIRPSTGLGLAGLILWGLRFWPAVTAGVLAAELLAGPGGVVPLATAGADTLAVVLGAWGLRRLGRLDAALVHLRDILWLIGWGGLASTAIAATLHAVVLGLGPPVAAEPDLLDWTNRWSADLIGVLVITPLVLSWSRGIRPPRELQWWLLLAGCTLVLGALTWGVFNPSGSPLFRTWLIFPALIWAALAFQVRGVSVVLPVIAAFASLGTSLGGGTLGQDASPQLQLVLLQQFIAVAATSALVLAVVADERQAREALRESEERFRQIATALHHLFWMRDASSNEVIYLSPAFERLWGRSREEMAAWPQLWLASMHPDDRERVREHYQRWRENPDEQSFSIDYRVVRPDGSVRWIADRGTAVRDEQGRVYRLTGVAEDITERKEAEVAAQEAAEQRRLAMDVAGLGTWTYDIADDLTWWDERCHEIFGLPPGGGPMPTSMLLGLVEPADRKRVADELREALDIAGPGRLESEYRVQLPDGELRWVASHGRRVGQRFVGTLMDITDRRQAEEVRREILEAERSARSQAERASRMKDEFVATLSHELRTPLHAILGWAQLLARREDLDEVVRRGLVTIERNARAQSQLVSDLLDMSRIVSGKLRIEVRPMDAAEAVLGALDTIRPAADAKGIQIERVLEPDIGLIRGDVGRVQQVVWNLLSNAVKFTPKGGKVRISLRQLGDQVVISVQDTGAGIKPEFMPWLFDRFRQSDSSTTRLHGGLGLGLSIVKQLVELHGGRVRAESEGEGKGATFTVELPLLMDPVPSLDDPEQPLVEPATPTGGRTTLEPRPRPSKDGMELEGCLVLAVDDEPDGRELVRRILEDRGARVLVAARAVEALEILCRQRPDVLVSDIGMPEIDGYEMLRRLRARPDLAGQQVPAVALTAFARPEDHNQAIAAGYQVHLTKPVDPEELVATVAGLADGTRLAQPGEVPASAAGW